MLQLLAVLALSTSFGGGQPPPRAHSVQEGVTFTLTDGGGWNLAAEVSGTEFAVEGQWSPEGVEQFNLALAELLYNDEIGQGDPDADPVSTVPPFISAMRACHNSAKTVCGGQKNVCSVKYTAPPSEACDIKCKVNGQCPTGGSSN